MNIADFTYSQYKFQQLQSVNHVYGQVPEPDMFALAGLPLFLEMGGSGNAEDPFAILPFLAWRWVAASSRVICSMCRSRELMVTMASLATSGFLLRNDWAWSGLAEKKMGTKPCANEPSKMSALRLNAPSKTETALSLLKNFFCMLHAAVGRAWISNLGSLVSLMPTAQRMQAPTEGWVVVVEVEGGLRVFRKNSAGTS